MPDRDPSGADVSVLLVCMGNICRSPMAEGWLSHRLAYRPKGPNVIVDSAGTHGYHAGSAPDPRAQAATARRGFHIGHLEARQVIAEDFEPGDDRSSTTRVARWILNIDERAAGKVLAGHLRSESPTPDEQTGTRKPA